MADTPAIGLPAGAPQRLVTPAAFPSVYDTLPARPVVMTDAEQNKVEDELLAARNQQQTLVGQPATPPPAAPAPAAAKKPQPAAKTVGKTAGKTAAKKARPSAQAAPAPPSSSSRSIY